MAGKMVLTPKRIAAIALAVLALGLIVALLRPRSPVDDAVARNGYRVARQLPSLRRETAERLRALEAASAATARAVAHARTRLRPPPIVPDSVVADTGVRIVVGPVLPTDTLIPLRLAREKLQEFADSASAWVAGIDAAITLERGRASLAILSLQRTIAIQDTVIAELRKQPSWYRRASRGVEAMVVGVACGGAGYVLGGPLGGIGAGLACAALDGLRR